MTTQRRPLRVLVTNDDGPPTPASGNSPFVFPFARALASQLGWDVRVVVPSSQKSWVGKSYQISQEITGSYYYPAGEDGTKGEKRELPDPGRKGEEPWILIDSTPATCSNLALYSLYPEDSFDLVVSGPNFGRNTSTAFALSSGTIGAALAASQSRVPAVALSFGLMEGHKPPGQDLVDGGVKAACEVISKLWDFGWGEGDSRVDVYSVNVPLLPEVLAEGGAKVEWTEMARTQYNRLFKSVAKSSASRQKDEGGPAAVPERPRDDGAAADASTDTSGDDASAIRIHDEHLTTPLKFVFSPDLTPLVDPKKSALKPGTDIHALHAGSISVTPIRAAFEPAKAPNGKWRL